MKGDLFNRIKPFLALAALMLLAVLVLPKIMEYSGTKPGPGSDITAESDIPSEEVEVASDIVNKKIEQILPASNDEKPLLSGFESPFVAVAEKLKPSVVNITVHKSVGDLNQFHNFDELWGRTHPEVTSSGSGVIVDQRGHVVTNQHVVENANRILVTLADGSEREAQLVGADPETDVALLDIGAVSAEMVAELGNSDAIRIGEWAVAMGNPLGLDWTLTVGVISAIGRSDLLISGGGPVFQDFIQTDASINFGNSGGPLTNIRGQVVGINAAVNTSGQGIGFAIPINMVREVISQLLEGGVVRRGYLGMVPVELDPLKAEALQLDEEVKGIFVESVSPGTPADQGGLEGSDVIIALDGEPVSDVADFRMRVARHLPGEMLSLTVLRNGREKVLSFALADRSEYLASARSLPAGGTEAWMGIAVAGLDSPQGGRMDLEVDRGVLIINVETDSPAEGKLREGDVIVRIDGEPVTSIEEWRTATTNLRGVNRAVLVMFYSQGKGSSRFVALKR